MKHAFGEILSDTVGGDVPMRLLVELSHDSLVSTADLLLLFFCLFLSIFCQVLEVFHSKLVGLLCFTGEDGNLLSNSSSSS